MKKIDKYKKELCKNIIFLSVSFLAVEFQLAKIKRDYSDYILKLFNITSKEYELHNEKYYFTKDIDNKECKSVTINLYDGYDYSYLNEMTNLERLIINDYSTGPILNNIDGSKFKNKIDIEIYKKSPYQSFNKERFGFLKDIPYINNLKLSSPYSEYPDHKSIVNGLSIDKNYAYNIDSKFLESLKNVHNLNLAIDPYFQYNYNDLTFLDSLYLNGSPYNVAITFGKDDIHKLQDAGVKLDADNYTELYEVVCRISIINKSIGITNNMSTTEKINRILKYVMEHQEYDRSVVDVDVDKIDYAPYYKEGYLDGALNNEYQICGNYAALASALLNSANEDSYMMISQKHAWNAIKIDDSYYYLDPTFLDNYSLSITDSDNNQIASINVNDILSNKEYTKYIKYLKYYLSNPEEAIGDETHTPLFVPEDIIKNQESLSNLETNTNITNNIDSKFIKDQMILIIYLLCLLGYIRIQRKNYEESNLKVKLKVKNRNVLKNTDYYNDSEE